MTIKWDVLWRPCPRYAAGAMPSQTQKSGPTNDESTNPAETRCRVGAKSTQEFLQTLQEDVHYLEVSLCHGVCAAKMFSAVSLTHVVLFQEHGS